MGQSKFSVIFAIFLLVVMAVGSAQARMALGADDPKDDVGSKSLAQPLHCLVGHRIGQMVLGVANNGSFGTHNTPAPYDYFTGQPVPDCEFPKNSNISYLYTGAFWVGAIVGRDTLVSVGADGWQTTQEMFPDAAPFGAVVKRSITDPEAPEYEGAVSEEDYIVVYMDTLTDGVEPDFFGRPHTPLNIEVTQSSYAWSYSYAEDFVLFDYKIRNIGTRTLEEVYMGIYVDADVAWEGADIEGATDDITGFLSTWPDSCENCEYIDSTVFTAWIADNDGDYEKIWTDASRHPCPAVTATRIVRTPSESDSLDVSFNWWIGNGTPSLDFGPRERDGVGRWKEPYRDFRTGGMGTPEGDLNKFYTMRNQEFDYDQIYTASIPQTDTLWRYPDPNQSGDFADGYDTRYFLSFGPFEIDPGQTLPISFAYVAGDSLHDASIPNNKDNLPSDPDAYYANLDFSDLAKNSRWASWVYDNPGVDTDGDGRFGEFVTCPSDSELTRIDTIYTEDPPDTTIDTVWTYGSLDTCWVKGDGVPDWQGASPPPAPSLWVEPSTGSMKVRFNGLRSETTMDVFSRQLDFEGYRVYLARDRRAASFQLMASYDRENYNKLVLDGDNFELKDVPFSLEQLRCLYADGEDPCHNEAWHPMDFTRSAPYIHPDFSDSIFIFEPQDYNVSQLGIDTPIRKRFPNQPYPSSLAADSADASELTEDGYFKYFEYEMEIGDLLPTAEWYVNVTAFDYGSPVSGLASLETPVDNGAQLVYALPSWNQVQDSSLTVYVYPNPYRLDGNYRDRGFEGRLRDDFPSDRVRNVHFSNLPPKCSIKIFTLDGDLVREIEHDVDPVAGDATHDTWNLITRNTQLVVPGLYYWTVETPYGETQIGKLVIIM
ncbi:MAG: hypothetical protein ABIE70_08300 [bacterium]